jgi:hypothetical protein
VSGSGAAPEGWLGTGDRYASCSISRVFDATGPRITLFREGRMTFPSAILYGGVRRERLNRRIELGEHLPFEDPPGLDVSDDRPNAILVVLEPDQNPREIGEKILWTLR